MRSRLSLTAAAGAAVLLASLVATPVAASGATGSSLGILNAHVMTTKGAGHGGSPFRSTNLYSHGGAVQIGTSVYISYWGTEWTTGFSTGGYSSSAAQTYVGTFFGSVGGSSWIKSDTQYCQNVPNKTTDCSTVAGAQYVTNPTSQLKGTWNDTTAVPSKPTQSDIAAAAVRLMNQVGYDANATYLVFSPSGKSMNGFGTSWCAWHTSTTATVGGSSVKVAYGYIPYVPDAGQACGMNFVNNSNNSFGNGYFDGFSIVAGHEYEEAQTDPFPSSGWLDGSGSEDADKCAWSSKSGDISLGGKSFAVQPLWSNASSGCVMSS